ncbi:MAG: lysine--tRNA ligase, partial [Clostridia bacterium]|nr:lysine--tRNA ligase [Clostridia bacterium]
MANENVNAAPQNAVAAEKELSEILQIRRDKLSALQEAGADPFQITKYDVTHHGQDIKDNYDELEGKEVSVAGRMMSKRIMGKASFCHVQDLSGTLQVYVARDSLGEEAYAGFKKWDIGDIIGVEGFVFRTQTGEVSIHAKKITLLAKSLLPLPEKFHGLKDQETRYRQRYVDLIVNPEVKDTFVKRSQILKE